MSDVKDILGMARAAPALLSFDAEPSKSTKAPKTKRPEGMSREAFALLGDSAPIVPSHTSEGSQPQGLKEKRKPNARGQVHRVLARPFISLSTGRIKLMSLV